MTQQKTQQQHIRPPAVPCQYFKWTIGWERDTSHASSIQSTGHCCYFHMLSAHSSCSDHIYSMQAASPCVRPERRPCSSARLRHWRCSVAVSTSAMAVSLGVRSACPSRPVTQRAMRRSEFRRCCCTLSCLSPAACATACSEGPNEASSDTCSQAYVATNRIDDALCTPCWGNRKLQTHHNKSASNTRRHWCATACSVIEGRCRTFPAQDLRTWSCLAAEPAAQEDEAPLPALWRMVLRPCVVPQQQVHPARRAHLDEARPRLACM